MSIKANDDATCMHQATTPRTAGLHAAPYAQPTQLTQPMIKPLPYFNPYLIPLDLNAAAVPKSTVNTDHEY